MQSSKTIPVEKTTDTSEKIRDEVSDVKRMLTELISMQRKDRFGDIPDELSEFYIKLGWCVHEVVVLHLVSIVPLDHETTCGKVDNIVHGVM